MAAIVEPEDFDHPRYREITESELAWLDRQFSQIGAALEIGTAIEYGCGVGVFTGALQRRGIKVLGLDLRKENIAEARKRHPGARYRVMDFDACSDKDFDGLPHADLGFAFGVLYHLENPLGTLRRMCSRARHIMMISTRVAGAAGNALWLHGELEGAAHNSKRVTAVPTLAAIVTGLRLGGFTFVYAPDDQPGHPQWSASAGNGRRHSLIAFRRPFERAGWRRIPPPRVPRKWQPLVPGNRRA